MLTGPGRNCLALGATRVRVNETVCVFTGPVGHPPASSPAATAQAESPFRICRRSGKPPDFPGTRPAWQVIILQPRAALAEPGTEQAVTDGN